MSDTDLRRNWLPFTVMATETAENKKNLLYLMKVSERITRESGGEEWIADKLLVDWDRNELRVSIFFNDKWLLGYDWTGDKRYYQAQEDEDVAKAVEAFKRALILEELADA